MVIPFGAIVFTIIHFKMSMLISEYKDKSKTSHGSYRTTNTSRLLSRAETITGILDSRYCTCQMKKDLNVKLNRVKEKIKTSAMEIYKKVEYIHKDKAQKNIRI
jgi:hypothetical protein